MVILNFEFSLYMVGFLMYRVTCNVIIFMFQDVKNSKSSAMTVAHHTANVSFYSSPLPQVCYNVIMV